MTAAMLVWEIYILGTHLKLQTLSVGGCHSIFDIFSKGTGEEFQIS